MAKQSEADKLVESTKIARIQSEVVLEDIEVKDRTKEMIHVRAKLSRTKSSILSDDKTTDKLEADLVLRVVPRSLRLPEGLQVAEWTITTQTPDTPPTPAPAKPSPNPLPEAKPNGN
jgi:hypothetical protein